LGIKKGGRNNIDCNPVKNGWVKQIADGRHSSIHGYVARGVYPANWSYDGIFNVCAGE